MPLGLSLGSGLALAAGVGAVGSIVGGVMNSNAASDAASAQTAAADKAAATQTGIYNTTVSNLAPYLGTGTAALSQLSKLFGLGTPGGASTLGPNGEVIPGAPGTPGTGPTQGTANATMSALTQYPGYQFQYGQGLQAIDRSAASRGLLLSGGQLKDAQTFGQGEAQSALGSYLTQLNSLGSLGENAGAITGNAGVNAGSQIGASQLAGGQSTAAGIVGGTNALTSGINSGLQNSLLSYSLFNNSGGGGSSILNPNMIGGSSYVPPV